MARAVGFIEAEGFVPIFDAVDAMVKATEVDVRGVTRLGGGIVAVVPDTLTLAVWSPALDDTGNSLLGRAALELFVQRTGLSVF